MKYVLPEEIRRRAFVSGNGELAWKREDLSEVVEAYTSRGYPVEGLEIWIVNNNGEWNGLVPLKQGEVPGVYSWDASPKKEDENSTEYCERTKIELFEALERLQLEAEIKEEWLSQVRYNLYVEAEYA